MIRHEKLRDQAQEEGDWNAVSKHNRNVQVILDVHKYQTVQDCFDWLYNLHHPMDRLILGRREVIQVIGRSLTDEEKDQILPNRPDPEMILSIEMVFRSYRAFLEEIELGVFAT